jgi:hypothetical protein
MKTKQLISFGLMALAIFAMSCNKNETEDVNYSSLPVEQHKTNIENTGQEMFDEMQAMEQEPAMQVNINLASLINTADPFEAAGVNLKKAQLEQTIAFAPIFATANYSETGMSGILKSMQYNPTEDPESIQEAYDMLIGVYAWDFELEDWTYTETGDKIVFQFPSEETGTTNNASYTIQYEGYTGTNPIEDYDGDIPQMVSAELIVDNASLSSLLAEMAYTSEGYPTSIEVTFTLGAFEWYMMASNTNNAAFTTEYSFKHSDTILLKLKLDASGNWTKENIEDNFVEETRYYLDYYDEVSQQWIWQEVTENDEWNYTETETEFNIHKIITDGNASFQIMNLKVAGAIDLENFGNKMIEIDDTYDWDTQEEQIIDEQVAAINQYVSLSLRYAESDEVIAVVEAYPVSESYSYESYYYNGTWNETPMTVTETDYWFDMRFVFSDGSKVDAASYFDDVFEDLIADLEDYMDDLEDTYGK